MKNVKHEVKGDKLLIEIDLSQEQGPSSTGKTTIIASSEGNVDIAYKGKVVKVGLNVYRK